MNADTLNRGVVNVEALYSTAAGDNAQALECQLVREDALMLAKLLQREIRVGTHSPRHREEF